MTKSAAKFASDVTVVANFLVCVFVEFLVTFWTVCACFKVFLLLCAEEHGLSSHFVVASVLRLSRLIKVAEKVDNAVFS